MKYDFYITGTIGEEFDWWTGQRGTTANMVKNFLEAHKDQEVNIAVSSLGGYIDDGLSICEYVKAHGKCNMIIIGMTASAATILCMKAKSVKIARGSMMLIHNSSQMLDVWTSANKEKIDELIKAFQHEREQLDTIDKCLADIYSSKNGKTIDENLELMAQEKWLTAKDALEFGLVDAILDDDEEAALKAKSVKNAYAGHKGAAEHYGLPAFASDGTIEQPRTFFQRMREAMSKVASIINEAEPDNTKHEVNIDNNNLISNIMNKTFIKVNALLKVEGLNETTDGVVLTVEQAQVVEDNLAELQGKVENLGNLENQLAQAKADKETAETAKNDAETRLANLQQEFDDFKAQAGGDTLHKPAPSAKEEDNLSSAEMFNQVKDIL